MSLPIQLGFHALNNLTRRGLFLFVSLYPRQGTLTEGGRLGLEQNALENVSNSLNTNIYTYLETSGGQSSNLYLNIVHFFNTSVN
jgi:hypothetical protein